MGLASGYCDRGDEPVQEGRQRGRGGGRAGAVLPMAVGELALVAAPKGVEARTLARRVHQSQPMLGTARDVYFHAWLSACVCRQHALMQHEREMRR